MTVCQDADGNVGVLVCVPRTTAAIPNEDGVLELVLELESFVTFTSAN
jgi:hypothetical protein